MATSRSPLYDGVDPEFLQAVQGFTGGYQPYGVQITSGMRPGDPRYHGKGRALDLQLIDRTTGKRLANYQDPTHATAYQSFANDLYRHVLKSNPALAQRLRWGGYFSPNDKHSLDLMHFDTGGGETPMGGGSWQGGWTPEMMKRWGLGKAGGLGGENTTGPLDPNMVRKAFLGALARGEAPGYNVLYGGKTFDDYSRHPMSPQTIKNHATGEEITSDTAGRYQFKGSTWAEQAKKYGYKDFSPETQDTAAWNYAAEVYKIKTGRDMATDLASRDRDTINNVGKALTGTWTSLPGGAEQGKAWEGKSFYDVINEGLGETTQPPASSPGNPAAAAVSSAPSAAAGTSWRDSLGAGLGALGESMGKIGASQAAKPVTPETQVTPTRVQNAPLPIVDPAKAQGQRQELAMLMQRLNSGRLY